MRRVKTIGLLETYGSVTILFENQQDAYLQQ